MHLVVAMSAGPPQNVAAEGMTGGGQVDRSNLLDLRRERAQPSLSSAIAGTASPGMHSPILWREIIHCRLTMTEGKIAEPLAIFPGRNQGQWNPRCPRRRK